MFRGASHFDTPDDFEGPLTCLEGSLTTIFRKTSRAPYLIAATRCIDYVTLHIVSGLNPEIIEKIGEFSLDRKLGVLVDASEFPSRPIPSHVPSRPQHCAPAYYIDIYIYI